MHKPPISFSDVQLILASQYDFGAPRSTFISFTTFHSFDTLQKVDQHLLHTRDVVIEAFIILHKRRKITRVFFHVLHDLEADVMV